MAAISTTDATVMCAVTAVTLAIIPTSSDAGDATSCVTSVNTATATNSGASAEILVQIWRYWRE